MKRVGTRGFTIVELLIVVVVIAILAAITIVAYNGIQARAQFSKTSQDLSTMKKIIEMHYADKGHYPISTAWSFSHSSPDGFIPGVVPDYASSLPRFTITTPNSMQSYVYRSTAGGADYKLIRLGQPTLPAAEKALVPTTMQDGTWSTTQDRYGLWSSGGYGL